MEEQVKRYRSLGHTVNLVTSEDRSYPASVIAFTDDDLQGVHLPHDNPLVISLQVDHCQLGRVLVDGGSGVDILFWEAFQKMGLEENQIRPSTTPILGFNSQRVYPKGLVRLTVVVAERTLPVDFLTIDSITSYNAIMGRNWIHRMQGVVSTLHQLPTRQAEVEEVRSRSKPGHPRGGATAPEHREIEECLYPSWLANLVGVLKKNEKKRVCIDYTNLNKACPKDSYPLPKIDQMIDTTAGYERMSFLDAYSGYNQIPMKSEDRIHTAFITEGGLYCYKVMPFGLKNAGATYQRLMHKLFSSLLGRNMEVYIDDVVIKSKQSSSHIGDLTECFDILDNYKMKLNPSKCAFGVSSGQFLGYVVSQRGIEANPTQIAFLSEVKEPRTIRDIQALTGKTVALSRFISRMSNRCQPFLQCIKKSTNTTWGVEQSKAYLSSPPILSSPIAKEDLFLFLSVSHFVMSSVLFREEASRQRPVFYCIKMLLDAETRYSMMEKLALALITAKKKLQQYFESHTIIVYTDYPLKQVLSKLDLFGRSIRHGQQNRHYDLHMEAHHLSIWDTVGDSRCNGTPFQNAKVQELCDTYKIKSSFASVTYPQGNGQAEASNKVIFANIKKNLEDKKGAWAEELPKVLWAYRTTKRSSTGESPYAMVYGTEAIILTEVGLPTLRTKIASDQTTNNIQLVHNLDLLEEVRMIAQLRRENYQKAAERYYKKRVHSCTFQKGDWVLRKVTDNKKKLEPNWEGLLKS
ncbi:uncharacterized protein LOC133832323 [Humulus lupulus]|uniref:uncharacterized protein LOC133832323 n=1 Tax=Humulus lupulus TaxID=3486 RepID=UPI002B414719|nr:uncharacterized protein LOC133832323 [Humulus lupulus]